MVECLQEEKNMKNLKELRASRTVNEEWWFKVKKYDCVKLLAIENIVEHQVMYSMKRQAGLLSRRNGSTKRSDK